MTCPFVTDWNIPQICIWEIIAFYGGTALCQQCLFLPVNLISWTVNNSYSDIAASSDSFPILDSFPRRWLLEWRQFLDRARSQTGYFLLMLIFSLSWLFIMVIKTNTFLNILIYLLYIFSVHCSPLCSSLLKQFFLAPTFQRISTQSAFFLIQLCFVTKWNVYYSKDLSSGLTDKDWFISSLKLSALDFSVVSFQDFAVFSFFSDFLTNTFPLRISFYNHSFWNE